MSTDFSTETLQARRDWHEIQWWEARPYNQDYSTQQSYHLKLKDRIKPRQESFTDRIKPKEFLTTKAVLQELFKGLLQEEEESQENE